MKTCFMCEQPATTKDHIPPRCFFPEGKDVKADYRKNLIAIPACDSHNLKTSKDDEYLMGVVAFHWRNNPVAYEHSITKVKRALKRNKRYYNLFFGEGKHQLVYQQGQPLVTTPVDIHRFTSCMQKITRGIYFSHFGKKWLLNVDVQPLSLIPIYKEWNPIIDDLAQVHQMMRQLCVNEPRHGENPDIFYYQLVQDKSQTSTIMRMVFYGGFEVIASLNDYPPSRNINVAA